MNNRFSPQTFARIKVIGIGGAGGNAINRMVEMGVDGIITNFPERLRALCGPPGEVA